MDFLSVSPLYRDFLSVSHIGRILFFSWKMRETSQNEWKGIENKMRNLRSLTKLIKSNGIFNVFLIPREHDKKFMLW